MRPPPPPPPLALTNAPPQKNNAALTGAAIADFVKNVTMRLPPLPAPRAPLPSPTPVVQSMLDDVKEFFSDMLE